MVSPRYKRISEDLMPPVIAMATAAVTEIRHLSLAHRDRWTHIAPATPISMKTPHPPHQQMAKDPTIFEVGETRSRG
jgi:hypothetical protein